MGPLAGQVAIVTGGGRGIGQAIAEALAAAGAAVAVTARSKDQLQETVSTIQAAGGRAISVVADVNDIAAVEQMMWRTEAELGSVDLLVNNAAIAGSIGPLWECDPGEWWQGVETNLRGPLLCCRAVLPGMIARNRGRIINLASATALAPTPYMSAYVCAKAGLLRFTDCLASELEAAQAAVSVFAVSPGAVRTRMQEEALASPAGRKWIAPFFTGITFGTADRIAALAVCLASGKADVLSGRFFSVADDVNELVRQAARIRQNNLYSLRLDKLPAAAT
jgi:NAD(P)-dependent dehydrogenase (short-subunit alcohol dehydrogenase family)